jgi:hypothetical protein
MACLGMEGGTTTIFWVFSALREGTANRAVHGSDRAGFGPFGHPTRAHRV